MPEGVAQGQVNELSRMKEEYYQLRGWIDGRPSEKKLEELELEIHYH